MPGRAVIKFKFSYKSPFRIISYKYTCTCSTFLQKTEISEKRCSSFVPLFRKSIINSNRVVKQFFCGTKNFIHSYFANR